ncbi:uncharacterized protein KQ657_003637 [Scheffersomyces spartinae]|uniref:Uncharacterized protein n=1 Tax=Scheffersomyces spartinae TaxID=45513 RepID=A0A9P7VBN4_9ASCO|nr:uncharacterized protein KQ657_003637 [Scheffersomyces spartinae]KAG7195116.1 hypothetical protein KQ657_003637 [Scheffersomyces spartinae]
MDLQYLLNPDDGSVVSPPSEPSEYTFLKRCPTTTSLEPEPKIVDRCKEPPSIHCENYGDLLRALKKNKTEEVNMTAQFVDEQILPSTTEDRRSYLLRVLHWKYVNPVTEATGYRWIKKEVTPKAWGKTVFTVKYRCSQQANSGVGGVNINVTKEKAQQTETGYESSCRSSRKLSHPLKEYQCNLNYIIRYHYSTSLIDITYVHNVHLPPKRLPDCVKPFILQRLDWKATDLFEAIMEEVRFREVRHLVQFNKVQGFWSQERGRRKVELTKAAFKQFFNTEKLHVNRR